MRISFYFCRWKSKTKFPCNLSTCETGDDFRDSGQISKATVLREIRADTNYDVNMILLKSKSVLLCGTISRRCLLIPPMEVSLGDRQVEVSPASHGLGDAGKIK